MDSAFGTTAAVETICKGYKLSEGCPEGKTGEQTEVGTIAAEGIWCEGEPSFHVWHTGEYNSDISYIIGKEVQCQCCSCFTQHKTTLPPDDTETPVE